MALLTAEQVKQGEQYKFVDVEVPEWGGSVRLRALSAADALGFLDFAKKPGNTNMAMLEIIRMCAVDESNNRLFASNDELQSKSLFVLLRLQREAIALNGFKREVGELLKNVLSGAAPEGSPIASL